MLYEFPRSRRVSVQYPITSIQPASWSAGQCFDARHALDTICVSSSTPPHAMKASRLFSLGLACHGGRGTIAQQPLMGEGR